MRTLLCKYLEWSAVAVANVALQCAADSSYEWQLVMITVNVMTFMLHISVTAYPRLEHMHTLYSMVSPLARCRCIPSNKINHPVVRVCRFKVDSYLDGGVSNVEMQHIY